MKFLNSKKSLKRADIKKAERSIGISLPIGLSKLYLASNGGEPEPYVFENQQLDTVVSEFLPLVDPEGGTAVEAYERLVKEKAIVPLSFFPFAVDGGGDYFFLDCSQPRGNVHFYNSDTVNKKKLMDLRMTLEEFFNFLKPEQD